MRENTPPHRPDFEDDDDDIGEEIDLDGDPPLDDDELEMEEVTLAELEARLGLNGFDDEMDNEGAEDDAEDRERIAAIRDDAVVTFRKHTAPVFGCNLHPRFDWAVTGSEDDRAYVWDTKNGDVLFEIAEHKDTITEAHFSHDGSYLATGDLSGELFVYKVCEQPDERPILSKVWEYSMSDMAWLFWHRGANVLLAGSDSGEVYVWRIPSGECKILPGQSSRCAAGELSHDGKKLFTVYMNGVVKLWDLKSCQVLMEVGEEHPLGLGEITHAVVACDTDSPLYLCAEGNGKLLFCTNNGPVNVVKSEHGIECIEFAPATSDLKLVACGSLDGQISIWDYAKYSLRSVCESPAPNDGILRLKWISDFTLLAATVQGNINAYDARSGALKFTLTGHHYHVYEFVYKPQENVLLTVSEDNTAKIFNMPPLDE
ncbi:angio-associated migratory cell protein [Drosophila nasuta]|uniref:Angio-associated migratory cell protein n=1 Tax=Drosophila albomicans TaxID=7291 RepID=A0A6P8XA26_DROAB|nr:angio-associated migratory cell protein [Drosophila albomicans]XP_060656254.1 angio-associated migratory cell protein [Drosophila nasuta]